MADKEITIAQMVAAEISKTGEHFYKGMLFQTPVRLPLLTYGTVEALAKRSGLTRNKVLNRLLDAGIEAVMAQLDELVVMDIENQAGRIATVEFERNGGELESGEA